MRTITHTRKQNTEWVDVRARLSECQELRWNSEWNAEQHGTGVDQNWYRFG